MVAVIARDGDGEAHTRRRARPLWHRAAGRRRPRGRANVSIGIVFTNAAAMVRTAKVMTLPSSAVRGRCDR